MANGEEGVDQGSIDAYNAWMAQQAASVAETSKGRTPWTMPLPMGGKNYAPSQAWQNSWNNLATNPVSGYSPNANYGAILGRFQTSNTAPVPATAPVGWGRYPGTQGGQPTAPWVTNPYMPSLPKLGDYRGGISNGSGGGGGGGGSGGGGLTPANPALPPVTSVGGARMNAWSPQLPPVPQNVITGATPQPKLTPEQFGKTPLGTGAPQPLPVANQLPQLVDSSGNRAGPPPQSTSPASATTFLQNFQFANAPQGSEAAKFNAIAKQYGTNDAMNYLMSNAWNTLGNQFQQQATQSGLSQDDFSRIVNNWGAGGGSYFPSLGGYNAGNYSWGMGAKSNLPKLTY